MSLLLYGATGYVGEAMARAASAAGLKPILAGRNSATLKTLGESLGLEWRAVSLDAPAALDLALAGVTVVLHCAGPFLRTSRPMVDACLRTGAHYLDITGEFPVFEAIAARDDDARSRGVMLMPGVGFDVVPTDCLAVYLKSRLSSATRLVLAFQSVGPSGLPPGTQRTVIELLPYGHRMRRHGRFEPLTGPLKTRLVDFGAGPVTVTQLTWGDVFTAWYSTGIPNIEDYTVLPAGVRRQLRLLETVRPLFAVPRVRRLLQRTVKPGPTPARRAQTVTHVWGEVSDDAGRTVAARLHGPEAGVEWTVLCALSVARRVLSGQAPPGFHTPGGAYGADLVMDGGQVTRENVAATNDPPARG
ncbi:MAG: saccharopine dehydrogenase NADP-binding domain-containing protein [Gemmatimonadaceae bacterium]|jgi:short subunit dehydrogenase-like uncharacterized protein|nr:saccharopine dehydrogenase NADP-binding domain-containing protein [Gemmatimonadaceae bacterium]